MPTVPDVPAFKHEPDSGNLAFLAAQAALKALGLDRSLAELAGVGGDAFKFVYDDAPVFEPLRDLRPWDSLARAFAACGLRAEWVPDATSDHVRGQVEAQAKVGRPVLTSFVPDADYHGFCLLTGYDEASDTLFYRQAERSPRAGAPYRSFKLDAANWNGPITGGAGWVDYPLLVIRGELYDPPDERTSRRVALELALQVAQGEPIPYPVHPGAQAFARVPLAGRSAPQGLAALEALASDLGQADLSAFSTIWRLDAQLMQLAWDRTLAALYLESWGNDAPADLIAQYRANAHTARTLASRNWEQRSAALSCLDDLRLLIQGTAAYLYALAPDPRIRSSVGDLGRVIETPWGAALLVETPARRQGAVQVAGRLLDGEQKGAHLLEKALAGL